MKQALAEVLAKHQRVTSRPGGPCWCGEWPRDDVRRDTWMDHVAAALIASGAVRPADEAADTLPHTSDEGLLRSFATLTHRLHAADRQRGSEAEALALRLRSQRDRVQVEILRRMQ